MTTQQAETPSSQDGAEVAVPKMMAIPDLNRADIAFGNIDHMPKFNELPEEFREWRSHPFCESIGDWFFSDAEAHKNGIRIKNTIYTAKDGVPAGKALTAIRAVMVSWAPKHEHKIAACGYMLHQWFDATHD